CYRRQAGGAPTGCRRAHFSLSPRSLRESHGARLCSVRCFFLLFTGKRGGIEWVGPRARSLIAAGRPAMLAAVEGGNVVQQAAGANGRDPVTQERIRELTKTMLRKKLYVVLSKGGAAPEAIAEHLPRHLEYMIGLEKKGVLFASGPLAEADGKMRG